MPTRTCKVCGEKVTVASGDLKYLHGATDFLCSPECVVAKIRSFAEQTPVSNIPFKEAEEIDPLGRTAAYSWKLGKNFRSEYEVAVAEFLNTCSLFPADKKEQFYVILRTVNLSKIIRRYSDTFPAERRSIHRRKFRYPECNGNGKFRLLFSLLPLLLLSDIHIGLSGKLPCGVACLRTGVGHASLLAQESLVSIESTFLWSGSNPLYT